MLASLLVILPLGLWSTFALWFRAPGPEWVRALAAAAFALIALTTIVGVFSARRGRSLGGFALAFGALLIWWSTIQPPMDRDWAPEVARQVTGVVNGDILTLTNQRDFDWITEKSASEKWVTQSYDLSKLRKLDIFLAYWAGPQMTHPMMSFEFEDGRHLAWSIEVRSKRGGEFSPIANLFKADPLVFLASDERDMVRLRSNIRGEDVQLYRLNTPPRRRARPSARICRTVQRIGGPAAIFQFDHHQLHHLGGEADPRGGRENALRLASDRQWLSAELSL